jgi:kynurenine formamidase
MAILTDLIAALNRGSVEIVDLTAPLSQRTPVLQLPEPFANTPGFTMEEISRYDERGPLWYWNVIYVGEHVGTHFDAPVHWKTGEDGRDVSEIPREHLVAPAVVIDASAQVANNPDFLLEIEDVRAWEDRHGSLPDGGWLLYRTGWDSRSHDQAAFLNIREDGPHSPGISSECARWLAEDTPIVGIGVETVGTDAGMAHSFDPAFPCHHFLSGANKYGITQLQNLARLPATGSLLMVAPLDISTLALEAISEISVAMVEQPAERETFETGSEAQVVAVLQNIFARYLRDKLL